MRKLLFCVFLAAFFVFLQVFREKVFLEETVIVLLYLIITFFSKNFKPRVDQIFAPQNIAFFVFFVRLYLLPCLGLFYGYKIDSSTKNTTINLIFDSYLITIVMYLAFVIGWEIRESKKGISKINFKPLSKSKIKFIFICFSCFGIITLYNIFSDFQNYILTVIYTKSADEVVTTGASFTELIIVLSVFFLPFVVFGFLSLLDLEKKSKIKQYFILSISFCFVLLFSLNSNRQSMVYPILALVVGFSKYIKFRVLPVVLVGLISLYFLFVFSNIRHSKDRDFDNSQKNSKEIVHDVEIYAGGSQMIAPVFKLEEKKFTIFNSFIYSFPIVGKFFRDESGVVLYNYLFYGYYGIMDQIFLTQAECYVNGGYLLIVFFFIVVGYYYSAFNKLFFDTINSQFLLRVSVFYLVLLYNSTILLSFQVMGQFLFYNALPALIIFKLYERKHISIS